MMICIQSSLSDDCHSIFVKRSVAESEITIVSAISLVNRMCFRYISGVFDHQNKPRICDSYRSDLCSKWVIFAL